MKIKHVVQVAALALLAVQPALAKPVQHYTVAVSGPCGPIRTCTDCWDMPSMPHGIGCTPSSCHDAGGNLVVPTASCMTGGDYDPQCSVTVGTATLGAGTKNVTAAACTKGATGSTTITETPTKIIDTPAALLQPVPAANTVGAPAAVVKTQ